MFQGREGPSHRRDRMGGVMTPVWVNTLPLDYSKNNRGLPLDDSGGVYALTDKMEWICGPCLLWWNLFGHVWAVLGTTSLLCRHFAIRF
jgi:hypothetical protein